MFIRQFMTHNPITVRPDTFVTDAQAILKKEKIHHLPVLDKSNKLVGIVTEKDLLYASPSPVSTLSVYEMSALFSKLKVERVMTKKVLTVDDDTLIEEAAHLLADNNIGGLPVMRGGVLVGIITESDIFRLFIELFGTRKKGIRVAAVFPERQGELAKIITAVAVKGGNIISIGTFPGEDLTSAQLILKVEDIPKDVLTEALKPLVTEICDLREV